MKIPTVWQSWSLHDAELDAFSHGCSRYPKCLCSKQLLQGNPANSGEAAFVGLESHAAANSSVRRVALVSPPKYAAANKDSTVTMLMPGDSWSV